MILQCGKFKAYIGHYRLFPGDIWIGKAGYICTILVNSARYQNYMNFRLRQGRRRHQG